MRAGLYARVSTEEQVDGYSIEEQFAAMRRYALDQRWEIAAQYEDAGASGTTADRPALQEALRDCEQGSLDILLTHQLDRFHRNLGAQIETLTQLSEWGVSYVSVVENLDYSTPQGMLFMQMLGAFNEYYSRNLSRETRKGKKGRARGGRTNASTTPYGYRREKQSERLGDPEPDPETSPAVVLAFETYAAGQLSDQQVADLLNREGHRPSGRARSGRWTREGVRYMLTNPFYIGQVQHGDDFYPGLHEPLIDQETWDQVQALRAQRNMGRGGGRSKDRVYLLARLARCEECGLRLGSRTSEGGARSGPPISYYQCPAKRRSVDCTAAGRMVPAGAIDEQVSALVRQLRLPVDWRDRLVELANHQEERDQVEGRRRYLQGKLRRLRDLYLEGDYTKAEYDRERASLRVQLSALQMPDQPVVELAAQVLENLADAWEGADPATRHEILRTLFKAIKVDVLGRRLICVQPHQDFLPLFRLDGLEEKDDGSFYYCGEDAQSQD